MNGINCYGTHSDPSHFLLDEHFAFLGKSVVNYENIVSETERHYGFATISLKCLGTFELYFYQYFSCKKDLFFIVKCKYFILNRF
jgi:hypothetical protein